MGNKAYMPYNFNLKYEYQTYKNIGKEYRIQYRAQKNILYKLYWQIRKLFNHNEKKYKNINKFSEWEEYVNKTRQEYSSDNKDFIHFLEGKARFYDFSRNIVGSIVTPIYAVMMSGSLTIFSLLAQNNIFKVVLPGWWFFSIMLICIFVFLLKSNFRRSNLYFFFRDYIKTIE